MKIVRFTADGVTRVGALEGDAVVELPGFRDTQELIAGGAGALEATRKAIASGAGRRPARDREARRADRALDRPLQRLELHRP